MYKDRLQKTFLQISFYGIIFIILIAKIITAIIIVFHLAGFILSLWNCEIQENFFILRKTHSGYACMCDLSLLTALFSLHK
jgi:hypothetical protein